MRAPGSGSAKPTWRKWAAHVRAGIDWKSVSSAISQHLATWQVLRQASTVLVFLPLPDEVDLTELVDGRLGSRFVATHTPDRDGVLTIHELGDTLERHRLGFLQPPATSPRVEPGDIDIVLLPGLAFGRNGVRLGRGAGYFDALLAGFPETALFVGVVPDELVVDELPAEPHDVPVHMLVTQSGLQAVGSDGGIDRVVRNLVMGDFAEHGRAPAFDAIAAALGSPEAAAASLSRLHERHVLVVDDDFNITMALPFSGVPTRHVVRTGDRSWFANCAWDALGIAVALDIDAEIRSIWADTGEPLDLVIADGTVHSPEGFIGFAVPARHWWDDIAFT